LPVAGGLVAGVLALPVLATVLPAEPIYTYADTSFPRFWFVYGLPLTRMLDFTLGIVMARLVLEDRWIRLGLPSAALLTLGGYGVSQVVPLLFSVAAAMVVPLALLVAAGARADVAALPSPLRGRTAGWLGEVSFAFYLIHIIVLYGAGQLSAGGWGVPGATGVIAGSFLVTLGLSALLYTGVERPAMRRLGRSRPVGISSSQVPPSQAMPPPTPSRRSGVPQAR
jgi:peptidoglycan/LPS O-acetylase OafA/YrhL